MDSYVYTAGSSVVTAISSLYLSRCNCSPPDPIVPASFFVLSCVVNVVSRNVPVEYTPYAACLNECQYVYQRPEYRLHTLAQVNAFDDDDDDDDKREGTARKDDHANQTGTHR